MYTLKRNEDEKIYIYGYTRCSTKEQDTARGEKEINKFCKDRNMPIVRIVTDKQTGKNFNRDGWQALKNYMLRAGDILVMTEVDRLGRSKKEILKELRELQDMEVRIMILEIPTTLIDYSTLPDELAKLMMQTINNLMIEIYASLAEAEMHKKKKRQQEGIQLMKERGEWERYGRKRSVSKEEFLKEYKKVQQGELRNIDLIRKWGIRECTFYRYKKEYLCGNPLT